MKKLIAVKKEMTQIFNEDGTLLPVTILDVSDNFIVKESSNSKDNYVLGGFSRKNGDNSFAGNYKNGESTPLYVLEVEKKFYDASESFPFKIEIREDYVGKKINVTAISKGKGFQGVMKRWGFRGGKRTHGQSDRMRAPGSIGSGTTPGRVLKGKKMAGRMGGEMKTVKNLQIVGVDSSNKFVLVKGAVPGPRNAKVIISFID